ncbi:MAG TPA: Hsp20/alpha crystallin family protein [Chloroflexota bacterium]|nr:Hsp20/alpha crystallin family protein [Chloroflexota bacterium]
MATVEWSMVTERPATRRASDPYYPSWSPPVDVYELADRVLVVVEAPGVQASDLTLVLESDRHTLRLSGRRARPLTQLVGRLTPSDARASRDARAEAIEAAHTVRAGCHLLEIATGHFSRVISLPCAVHPDLAAAEYQDGLLVITLMKPVDTGPVRVRVHHAPSGATPSTGGTGQEEEIHD